VTRQQTIQEKLTLALQPTHLAVEVVVVSEAFEGLGLIDRHRRINEALAAELRKGLHALTIRALTPTQWSEQGAAGFQSPACLGGSKE
jgi:stress-induced morphogen